MNFLKIFNEIAKNIGLELYENFEYMPFFMFFREMFCLLKPDEIPEEMIDLYENSYIILYNGCLKCLFPKKDVEEVLLYAYLFGESKDSHNVSKVCIFSLICLKI